MTSEGANAASKQAAARELQLRPARESDVAFLRALTGRVFLAYGSYEDYLADWFRDPAVTTELAEWKGSPAGFFMLAIYPDAPIPKGAGPLVSELLSIAVVPEHQGAGVGARLLDRCIELATDPGAGIREVRLSVAEGNARARRLFASRGFRLREGFAVYPAGQRALLMRRST